jgi:hypothetical protein
MYQGIKSFEVSGLILIGMTETGIGFEYHTTAQRFRLTTKFGVADTVILDGLSNNRKRNARIQSPYE